MSSLCISCRLTSPRRFWTPLLFGVPTRNINCNRAVITMVRRAAFKRLYPIMFIQPDGSTFTARYEIPRAIIKLPVNPNVLTAAELERHREQLRPRKKMAQEDMLDDVGFKRDRYSHLWRQRAAGSRGS